MSLRLEGSNDRPTVRRALELLAADELVDIRTHRGATVASPTLEEADDLFAVRIDLERVVTRRLCGTLLRDHITRLNKAVA
jgi:DNA-binding GntR family transcriptional regulator